MWLGYEQGLAIYDPRKGVFLDFEFNHKKAVAAAVRSICEDLSGSLWIGSYSGLYILNPERSDLKHIVHGRILEMSQISLNIIMPTSRHNVT